MDKLSERTNPDNGFIEEIDILGELQAAYIGDKKPEKNEQHEKEEKE